MRHKRGKTHLSECCIKNQIAPLAVSEVGGKKSIRVGGGEEELSKCIWSF